MKEQYIVLLLLLLIVSLYKCRQYLLDSRYIYSVVKVFKRCMTNVIRRVVEYKSLAPNKHSKVITLPIKKLRRSGNYVENPWVWPLMSIFCLCYRYVVFLRYCQISSDIFKQRYNECNLWTYCNHTHCGIHPFVTLHVRISLVCILADIYIS